MAPPDQVARVQVEREFEEIVRDMKLKLKPPSLPPLTKSEEE